jgi:hypothetical protein
MAKKPKFKLGAEVRRVARDKMPPIPAKRVIPDKRTEQEYSCDFCAIRGCLGECLNGD